MDFHVQSNPEASFKTYFLDKEDRIAEIRRFVLPYPLHVGHLDDKIRTLYNIARSQEVRLQWLDPENDRVTFTTNEELRDAIRAVANAHNANINRDRTLRVYVSLSQDSMSSQSVIHPSVVCDGCEQQPIRGYRFKCAICPDYDLCCECVVKNQHSEHPMILLRRPRDPVMFRLSQWLHRSYWARKCRGAENAGASNAESVSGVGDCPGAGGVGGGLSDNCMRILRELEAAATKVVQHQQQQQLQQQLCGFSEASMEELQRSEQLPLICQSDSGDSSSSSSQEMLRFVHGISSHLNALLQPLGIEVSYHASAQQQQQQQPQPPQPQSPTSPCVARQQQQQVPEAEPNRQQQAAEHSGDFVMVGDEAAAASAAAAAAAAEDAAATRGPLLPSHVATALEQMRAMGFTDEGGLLTELLVSTNGNIDRVLDVLRQN